MKKIQAITIWLTATLFAVYELFITNGFYGVSLSLQQHELNLATTSASILAAVGSLVYAICQIPAGILVGRYSIKIILTVSTILVTTGMFVYSKSFGINGLLIGRILISIGSAFAFVSIAVLIGRWLPKAKFSLFFGLTQCLGNLSVVSANMFLPKIIHNLNGWRITSFWLSMCGVVLAIIVCNCSPHLDVKSTA